VPDEGSPNYPSLPTSSQEGKIELLMNNEPMARRHLVAHYDSGGDQPFSVTISVPIMIEEGRYSCEIYSDDIAFRGTKTLYGVDSIDCIDYAIELMDTLLAQFSGGRISWPDSSPYIRVPTIDKLGWSKNQGVDYGDTV
jgi:hypothetical protein